MNKQKLIIQVTVIVILFLLCFGSATHAVVFSTPAHSLPFESHIETYYVKLEPIASVPLGEDLVVNGTTNREEGTLIIITVEGPIEFLPKTTYVENATFSAIFNTTGAPAGNYTVKADDGDGNIDEITVEILPIEPILTPKIMPTVTSTLIPISSPSPTPTITPTPTVTPTPTPTGKPKLRITHELSAKTGEILLTTCIENIGEGEAKDVKLTMGVPSQIKAENLVGISAVGNTLVWTGELKQGEKHIIKQSIIPLKNEDIEIPLAVSYIDPTTHELVAWDTIIKIIAEICCLFCDDKCCEMPTLGIGATVAAFGIVYLLVRQRRKLGK